MKDVSVIVSHCIGTRIYGDRLIDKTFPTVDAAMIEGRKHCDDRISVVVRPNYNERDDRGAFFREWRSFNGSEFGECRWAI